MHICSSIDLKPLQEFLQIPTPSKWIQAAKKNLDLLLIDHAHCERKAALTALGLLSRYPERGELLIKLSTLAREELLHFEKVLSLINKRGIRYLGIKPSDYAKDLHQLASNQEPERLIDALIIGAIIEARSCERFAALIPHLDQELASFYHSLLKSEARHFRDYLGLAEQYSDPNTVRLRCQRFLERENELISQPSELFRFHSGLPEVLQKVE